MDNNKSIKKNYIFSLSFQVFSVIVPLITTPYLARVLGPDNTGIYSLTNTNVSYFTLLGVLGLGTYGQLEVAKVNKSLHDRSKVFWELISIRVFTHSISIIIYFILILLSAEYRAMYVIQISIIIASMLDISWFFQGVEEFKQVALRNIAVKALSVVAIFIFVKCSNDLIAYAFIMSFSNLICSLSYYLSIKKQICKIPRSELEYKKHLKGTMALFIPTIASVIMTSLDKTMIGAITRDEAENGYYAQAYKIEILCFSLFSSLNIVMRSRMAYLHHENEKNVMSELLSKSLRFVALCVFPISLGTIGITESFVPWFFGDEFLKVTLLLPIFSLWLIFKAYSNCILEQYVMASGRQKVFNVIIWIGAICNVILNLFLIHWIQSVGAAIGSLISEIVIFILAFRDCRIDISLKKVFKISWKYIVSSLVMLSIVFSIGRFKQPVITTTIVQIIVGSVVYVLILTILRDETISGLFTKLKWKICSRNHKG